MIIRDLFTRQLNLNFKTKKKVIHGWLPFKKVLKIQTKKWNLEDLYKYFIKNPI